MHSLVQSGQNSHRWCETCPAFLPKRRRLSLHVTRHTLPVSHCVSPSILFSPPFRKYRLVASSVLGTTNALFMASGSESGLNNVRRYVPLLGSTHGLEEGEGKGIRGSCQGCEAALGGRETSCTLFTHNQLFVIFLRYFLNPMK
jgi:hypothetical protein